MAEIAQFEVGMLLNFNVLLWCENTRLAAVVDPAFEVDRLLREAKERELKIVHVLLTHTHHDHVDGAEEMALATGAKVHVGAGEVAAAQKAAPRAEIVGLPPEGQVLQLGDARITTIATPGHTVAGTSYLCDGRVMTGDTMFVGGCGRTDFPGGDPRIMWRSLQRLCELPEETRVYPGHDYGATVTSTIGWERDHNPYLLCKSEDEFVALRTGQGGKTPPRPTRGAR